jgi:hypothetical protein
LQCRTGRAGAHRLDTLGEVTIHFDLLIADVIRRGHHGVALFSANRELIWGKAIDGIQLMPGVHRISYTFPYLPLRPGPYYWQVSLWEDDLLDLWDCLPEMVVETANLQHPRDEWSGLLNVPSEVCIGEWSKAECAEASWSRESGSAADG